VRSSLVLYNAAHLLAVLLLHLLRLLHLLLQTTGETQYEQSRLALSKAAHLRKLGLILHRLLAILLLLHLGLVHRLRR
jgi:hypothetical protein